MYEQAHLVDLGRIDSLVAAPHNTANVVPLSQVAGAPVQQAFIGTCTNGRLEDLAAAASVLRAPGGQVRRVAGDRLLVVPASSEVLQAALLAGYVETFVATGALIGTPGCGPCMGTTRNPGRGETVISTANRNFKGRMGNPAAEIYLASPQVVAASAVLADRGPEELT